MNKERVIGMLFDSDFDSGEESELEEDPAFPLPMPEETEHTPGPEHSLFASPTVGRDEEQCETEDVLSQERESQENEARGAGGRTGRSVQGSGRGRVTGRGRGRGRKTRIGRGRGTEGTFNNRDRSPHAQGKVFTNISQPIKSNLQQ